MTDVSPYTRRSALGLLGGTMCALPVSGLCQPAAPLRRPRYHIAAPPGGWINDPQRPIRTADGWTLWALYNPTYPKNGTAWRRWTSKDLVTWVDRGVAIPRNTTPFGDIWTGSTVRDPENRAGFGANAIIALATMPARDAGGQNQSCGLWYSLDEGASFTFHGIVLPNFPGHKPFRDPAVFWHKPTGRWVLTLSEEGKIGIYTSADLKAWRYASGFLSTIVGSVMECSHLFRLHLYDADGETHGDKWVLLVGGNGTAQSFTVGTYYWVGDFDGTTFTADSATGQWLDGGADYYAAVVWTDPLAADPLASAYTIGWMSNWDYANQLPTTWGYRGQLSIVRQLRLRRIGSATRLWIKPLDNQNSAFSHAIAGIDQVLSEEEPYTWPMGETCNVARVDLTLTRIGEHWPSQVRFSIRRRSGNATQILFRLGENAVSIDRSQSDSDAPNVEAWRKVRTVACDFTGGRARVSLLLDVGAIELFLNEGAATISELILAPSEDTYLHLVATGKMGVNDLSIRTWPS